MNIGFDIPDLQKKLKQAKQNSKFKVVKKLKFQNTIYQSGDDIRIRQNFQTKDQCYGKIILIAQSDVAQFPTLLVCWYYRPSEDIISSIDQYGLSKKELVLSTNSDWQYIEAVKGKITVLMEEQYRKLDLKEQERQNLFLCRTILTENKQLLITSKRGCFCQKYYQPQNPATSCVICGLMFHPSCSGRQDRCLLCRF